jgi:hypothetical protein
MHAQQLSATEIVQSTNSRGCICIVLFRYVTRGKGVAARVSWLAFKEEGLTVRDPSSTYFPSVSHGRNMSSRCALTSYLQQPEVSCPMSADMSRTQGRERIWEGLLSHPSRCPGRIAERAKLPPCVELVMGK